MSALSEEEMAVVYQGNRSSNFTELLRQTMRITSLKQDKIEELLTPECLEVFSAAFTHPSASDTSKANTNYEWYEFIGDSIANLAVIMCISARWPNFHGDSDAVRVGTRIKINTVSKAVFCELARELGFWPFISATMEFRTTKMRPLLEDSFEAFLGAFAHLVDTKLRQRDKQGRIQHGAGFQFCFEIVRKILSNVNICGGVPDEDGVQRGKLKYDQLVDWITQLKELFDLKEMQEQFGKVKYSCERIRNDNNLTESKCYTTVSAVHQGRYGMRGPLEMGKGVAALQADSKQNAAREAVMYMRRKGYTREMRPAYAKFCQ